MNKTTIQSIRKAGSKIRVSHFRYISGNKELFPISKVREGNLQHCLLPTGGKTILTLTDKSGKNFRAEAACSKKDHFCRKTALGIAICRLVYNMENGIVAETI